MGKSTTNGPLSIAMLVCLMGKSFSIFTDIGITYPLVNVYRLRTGQFHHFEWVNQLQKDHCK